MQRWLTLVVSIVLFYGMFLSSSVHAAGNIEFQSYQFSSPEIFQGASEVYVDLKIANNGDSSLVVHGASAHFDWQAANESFILGSQIGGESWDLNKMLEPNQNYSIRIRFSVPTSASDGAHVPPYFKVFYNNGSEVTWNPLEQDPYAELIIHNMWEPQYANSITSVEDKVAQAKGAGFISPEAKSLAQQAEDLISSAHSSADNEDWQKALSYLNAADDRVRQAYGAEQRFQTYLAVGGVVGVAAFVGGGLFIRQRRKERSLELSSKEATESS